MRGKRERERIRRGIIEEEKSKGKKDDEKIKKEK